MELAHTSNDAETLQALATLAAWGNGLGKGSDLELSLTPSAAWALTYALAQRLEKVNIYALLAGHSPQTLAAAIAGAADSNKWLDNLTALMSSYNVKIDAAIINSLTSLEGTEVIPEWRERMWAAIEKSLGRMQGGTLRWASPRLLALAVNLGYTDELSPSQLAFASTIPDCATQAGAQLAGMMERLVQDETGMVVAMSAWENFTSGSEDLANTVEAVVS
jgi:ribosomal protein L12E/L44/L45/RPP1/RPP2